MLLRIFHPLLWPLLLVVLIACDPGNFYSVNVESSEASSYSLIKIPLLKFEKPFIPIPSALESTKVHTAFLDKGLTLSALLVKFGFKAKDVEAIGKALSEFIPLNGIPEGMRFDFIENLFGNIEEIQVDLSDFQKISMNNYHERWIPSVENKPVTEKSVVYKGWVKNSLWGSAYSAGVHPEIIMVFAEIFSWQIDFSREIRPGDFWRFEVLEKRIDGKVVGWEPLPRAQYYSKLYGQFFDAYLYRNEDKEWGQYYDAYGNSLRRSFLRSPIPFGRVTSRFSRRRFHPIRKIYRPHNGIDYGAPLGTPVRAVSSGRVTVRRRGRGSGNWISIQHKGGFLTNYLHLHRFSETAQVGSSIEQGQVIGFVGQTGSATGPHLHFEMKEDGVYIDPMKAELPQASSLSSEARAKFHEWVEGKLWPPVAGLDDIRGVEND